MTISEIFQIKDRLDKALREIDQQSKIKLIFYNTDNECLPFYIRQENDLFRVLHILDVANFIDKGNADDLFRKMDFVSLTKSTFELTDFKRIDSRLKKVMVGILV